MYLYETTLVAENLAYAYVDDWYARYRFYAIKERKKTKQINDAELVYQVRYTPRRKPNIVMLGKKANVENEVIKLKLHVDVIIIVDMPLIHRIF